MSCPEKVIAMRVFLVLLLAIVFADSAAGQGAPAKSPPDREYATARAALEAMRSKSGVKISTQGGWTVIEDHSTLSLWSFPPPGHPAYPAAVHRKVVQEGDNILVQMNVLCEAPKPACDAMVVEFQKLNGQVREDLKR
jgi:hypothetical protein